MKKIIALALALIMALSMASVAFAAATPKADYAYDLAQWGTKQDLGAHNPGDVIEVGFNVADDKEGDKDALKNFKITKVDFTTKDFDGASLIDEVKITKEKDSIRITLKESYTMALETAKTALGKIYLTDKTVEDSEYVVYLTFTVNNKVYTEDGGRKASEAEPIANEKNAVTVMEEAGFVSFDLGELDGVAKVAKNDKVYLNANVDLETADPDQYDALVAAFGEDYEGIVEMYTFETKALEDVAFTYSAWAEDPHFFYAWDGEKLTQIEAKYDDDEDVEAYVFTADAAGTIVITDEEVVLAAEETKNPDTGANDVVGVAAALAVVSLVAAGAVSLKK